METYSDERILRQPIGYWASMAGRSAVTLIRENLARHGLTQPGWWFLNYLAERPEGATIDELVEFHRGFVDTDDALRPDALALIDGGLVASDAGQLTVTSAGQARRGETWATIREALDTLRTDVSDDEFTTTIRTLQRIIDNAGDHAWHA